MRPTPGPTGQVPGKADMAQADLAAHRRQEEAVAALRDPQMFIATCWPAVTLYDKQWDVLYSVLHNDITLVYAGNQLGKDFIAALAMLWFYLTRYPCRIVATSADYSQLQAVLWGETNRFIQTSAYPLESTKGGPLLVNHMRIRQVVGQPDRRGRRAICPVSYMEFRTAARGEGMLGHHCDLGDGIPHTLFVGDESSGVDDESYKRSQSWAQRMLLIGNPYGGNPGCTFFQEECEAGDLPALPGTRHPHAVL